MKFLYFDSMMGFFGVSGDTNFNPLINHTNFFISFEGGKVALNCMAPKRKSVKSSATQPEEEVVAADADDISVEFDFDEDAFDAFDDPHHEDEAEPEVDGTGADGKAAKRREEEDDSLSIGYATLMISMMISKGKALDVVAISKMAWNATLKRRADNQPAAVEIRLPGLSMRQDSGSDTVVIQGVRKRRRLDECGRESLGNVVTTLTPSGSVRITCSGPPNAGRSLAHYVFEYVQQLVPGAMLSDVHIDNFTAQIYPPATIAGKMVQNRSTKNSLIDLPRAHTWLATKAKSDMYSSTAGVCQLKLLSEAYSAKLLFEARIKDDSSNSDAAAASTGATRAVRVSLTHQGLAQVTVAQKEEDVMLCIEHFLRPILMTCVL